MPKSQKPNKQATLNKVRLRSAVILDTLTALGYSFKFNELTQYVEVNNMPLTDSIAAQIRRDMRDMNISGMDAVEDAYIAYAHENTYHPILDCFKSLKWDGRLHIQQLATFFTDSGPVVDSKSWSYIALRRWLVGYVSRIYSRTQLPMLVLEGAQRKGKSTFVKWLASILPEDYFIEGPISPDNKDHLLRLGNKFIWEVNELGSTIRKADVEALKGFITLNNVTVRRPYGKHDITLPATAGLIGTINDASGFLNDSTGTRRSLIVPITDIDWGYTQCVDVLQVWAEAIAAYRAGESPTPDATERATQEEINSNYESPNSVEDVLLNFYEINPAMINDPVWFTASNDIRQCVDAELKGTSQQHAIMIALTLKKLGAVRTRFGPNRSRGFYGVKRKFP